MRILAFVLLLRAVAFADVCNPVCASQPPQCCGIQSDTFLAEECTGATSETVHFVLTDGTGWVDLRTPASFSVSGKTGSVSLGDVMPISFGFTIGTSTSSARFQIIDSTLAVIGQCVGTAGDSYTIGFPLLVSDQGRALQASGRNPLYCREGGSLNRDLLCFQVKGQVGPPFQAQQLCDPDRVEYICGVVQ